MWHFFVAQNWGCRDGVLDVCQAQVGTDKLRKRINEAVTTDEVDRKQVYMPLYYTAQCGLHALPPMFT